MFNRTMVRIHLCLHVLLILATHAAAQIKTPVKWNFYAASKSDNEIELTFTAAMDEGWHIYSQLLEEGGPMPTTFTFSPSEGYELIGKVEEKSTPVEKFDPTFMMPVVWFDKTAVFTQKVKVKVPTTTVSGKVEFMACTDYECLLPEEVKFDIPVKGKRQSPVKVEKQEKKNESGALIKESPSTGTPTHPAILEEKKAEPRTTSVVADTNKVATTEGSMEAKKPDNQDLKKSAHQKPVKVSYQNTETKSTAGAMSIWTIFIAGLLGGLAAILMPCIFPMLPLTISFFTKQGAKSALWKSLLFGLSIVVIYVALGLVITLVFGSAALNELSTSGVFNMFFFLLLLVFAASLLGAFEINLPTSWVNKSDQRADRGGVAGIFFMAFTLALVSFSCTGPIIGTLLVEAASKGDIFGPAIGMLGFALALALPFTLFALFPSMLKQLPKSGSWLNNVKISLGFLELALALKFLSNVDLAYHWEWFDREVFLALWIIIFALLGFYLLGKLKFSALESVTYITPVRLSFAIVTLAFTLYMIPGLWGAPLKAIAAFLPPQQTQDFDLYTNTLNNTGYIATVKQENRKYEEIFHAPFNLNAFFDYEEGMAYARKVKKPVMIDFTGHACVNCRKMETVVWSDPQVMDRLRDYVLIQLYVDDKTELPDAEKYISAYSGKEINTIGNKWSDLQASMFNTNSQPYYVLLNPDEVFLTEPRGADYNTESFRSFLDKGVSKFEDSYVQ